MGSELLERLPSSKPPGVRLACPGNASLCVFRRGRRAGAEPQQSNGGGHRHARRAAARRPGAGASPVGGLRRCARVGGLGDRGRAGRRAAPTRCSSRTPWSCSATSPCSPGRRRGRAARSSSRPEDAVRALGFAVARIDEPGTLDGGDVLKVGARRSTSASRAHERRGHPPARTLLAPRGYDRRRGPLRQRAAPEDRRHGAARRHDHRCGPVADDPSSVPGASAGPGGVRRARGGARRRPLLMSADGAAERGAVRARLRRDRRRHRRVREARGLRDLPVGSHSVEGGNPGADGAPQPAPGCDEAHAVDTEPSRAPAIRPRPRAPMQSRSNGCSCVGAQGSPRPGRRGESEW